MKEISVIQILLKYKVLHNLNILGLWEVKICVLVKDMQAMLHASCICLSFVVNVLLDSNTFIIFNLQICRNFIFSYKDSFKKLTKMTFLTSSLLSITATRENVN